MQYAASYVTNGYTFPVIIQIKKTYKLLQGSCTKWFCINCTKKEIPFNNQTNQELEKIYSGKYTIPYKATEIESFTTKINNRISDEK